MEQTVHAEQGGKRLSARPMRGGGVARVCAHDVRLKK